MSRKTSEMQFLTRGELKALLDRLKMKSQRDYAMVLLAYRHGMRASEVCNITMQNLDLEAGNIRCQRGKGSISNWQQLASDEIKAVKTWLRKRPKVDADCLFVSNRGTPMSRCQFFRLFKDHAHAVGIPEEKQHPHVLKHSLGTHLANAGMPVQVIQARLGHRNIQNTMVYLQVSSGFVDKAFEAALANGAVV
jgi:site-specific recombinase XerD